MPCIRPDGSLTLAARDVMSAMSQPRPVDDIRELSRQPLYRVRASLRELGDAGLIEAQDERWVLTDAGRTALAESGA